MSTPRHVIVCGAGVIGACTAHYLSERGVRVTLIEGTGVACAASGHSGGFLARDWCDGSPLQTLARTSFDLHAALGAKLGNATGYRRLKTLALSAAASAFGAGAGWLGTETGRPRVLGLPETTAQIDPRAFTETLVAQATSQGTTLVHRRVDGLVENDDGGIVGVRLGDDTLAGDAVVIAMGPWSLLASRWLPLPAVLGLKGHSIRLAPVAPVPAEALFVEDTVDAEASPEIYPRPNGEVYVCGLAQRSHLPLDPASIEGDADLAERLQQAAARVAPTLAGARLLAVSACFRPVTLDGLPLIGPVPGRDGAWVATGHSVWGMLNGPATGQALAGHLLDGGSEVDLAPFAVHRPSAGPTDFELS